MRIKEKRKQLVRRHPTLLNAESLRVITRPHIPGDKERIKGLIDRVSKLSDDDISHLLEAVLQDFSGRHRNFRDALEKNFNRISKHVPNGISLSSEQQLLLGAYFTAEYSVESAALFNPSIVPHPDQKGVEKGSQRFVMSFRATGEGHVSSIEFRSGIVVGWCGTGRKGRTRTSVLKGCPNVGPHHQRDCLSEAKNPTRSLNGLFPNWTQHGIIRFAGRIRPEMRVWPGQKSVREDNYAELLYKPSEKPRKSVTQ